MRKMLLLLYMARSTCRKKYGLFVAYIGLDSDYVSYAMKDLYPIWNNNPYMADFARYYSMTLYAGRV